MAGLLHRELAVQERESLRRDRGDVTFCSGPGRVAEVEHFEHRHDHRALDMGVDRTTGSVLLRGVLPDLVGVATAFEGLLRDIRTHARSEHGLPKLPAHSK